MQPASYPTPKISIPTFTGMQKDWDSFKELLTASIINDGRLSNVIKLQHLINSVSRPAKQALNGIPVISTNFTVARDKLRCRYDSNKRRLYVHLQSLIHLPQVTAKSSEKLGGLVDKVEEAVKGLMNLGCPINEYDNWFVHLLVEKLDSSTKRDWSIHEGRVEGFSTYSNLLKFLEDSISSLSEPCKVENYDGITSPPPIKSLQSKKNKKDASPTICANYALDVGQPKGKKNASKFIYFSE